MEFDSWLYDCPVFILQEEPHSLAELNPMIAFELFLSIDSTLRSSRGSHTYRHAQDGRTVAIQPKREGRYRKRFWSCLDNIFFGQTVWMAREERKCAASDFYSQAVSGR